MFESKRPFILARALRTPAFPPDVFAETVLNFFCGEGVAAVEGDMADQDESVTAGI